MYNVLIYYFVYPILAPCIIFLSNSCAVLTSLETTKAWTGCWACSPNASASWFVPLAPTTLNAGTDGVDVVVDGTETPPPPPVWQPDGEKWRSFQDNFDIEGAYAYLQEGIDFGIGLSDKTLREIFDILAPIAKEQFPAYDYLYPEEWPTLNYELNNESTSSP